MSLWAPKRRKLSDDPDEEASDDFTGFSDASDCNARSSPAPGGDLDEDETVVEAAFESEDSVNGDLESEESDVEGEDGSGEELGTQNGREQAPSVPTAQSGPRGRRANSETKANSVAETYTGGAYKSNAFKLQLDDLLDSVRLKHGKREVAAEGALRVLKATIEQLPPQGPFSINEAEKWLLKTHQIAIPFPEPRPSKDAQYKLEYARPSSINAIGSYPLRTATKKDGQLCIDLAITIPSALLQDKDYLNYRYFYKRAFYLACIAFAVKDAVDFNCHVSFEYKNGNQLQPILVVQQAEDPRNNVLSPYRIHVIPIIFEGVFRPEKTSLTSTCVRKVASETEKASTKPEPTPFYNMTLRSDSQVIPYLKFLHSVPSQCDSFKDACLLGRIWLRQRGLSANIADGGFGNFEWAALVAILLQREPGPGHGAPILSPGYSSYQLFKATLQFIASKDLIKRPYVFQASEKEVTKGNDQPILYDGLRKMNILFKMTASSFRLLQQEAWNTVANLARSLPHQFDATFIYRTDSLLHRFDVVMKLPCQSLPASSKAISSQNHIREQSKRFYSFLSQGLGDRVRLISITSERTTSWNVEKARPSSIPEEYILVGLVLDPAHANRAVDHGPSAEDKEAAAAFRQFWGPKAELRRFKDGSIVESLVWPSDSPQSATEQIVAHLLRRHISDEAAELAAFVGPQFDRHGPLRATSRGVFKEQLDLSPFQPLMTAFEKFGNDVRGLEGMPLKIRHIFAACPQLRYSSTVAPNLSNADSTLAPADVVVQFEGSGRWPDDLVAIQRTKIAFLLKMGELLEEATEVTTRVGLENEQEDILNQPFLDVTYSSGARFRVRIHNDCEQDLLERLLKDKRLEARERESVGHALAIYKRDFIRAPSHTQSIQTLCTRFPTLSPTMRLVKKWFESHLISNHVSQEFIELVVAHTFVHPVPWQAPSSARTGFLRSILFLSRWNWQSEPLVTDFSGDMGESDRTAIETRFEAWRKIDPALNRVVLFAASNIDLEGTTWTDQARPPKVVAARMTGLAKAASQLVQEFGPSLDPASLFVSPLTDYDFVIHLDDGYTRSGRRRQGKGSSQGQYKNLQMQGAKESKDILRYKLVSSFVADLGKLYGHAITFFSGADSEGVIGGLWNPSTGPRRWKVKTGFSTRPHFPGGSDAADREEDMPQVAINRDGVLADIARLGEGLVARIEKTRNNEGSGGW